MTEKLKQEVNPLSEVVQQIAKICPAAVQDGKIDFERLRTEWSADLNEPDMESYNFTWVGKNAAIAEANKKIRKTLRPVKADSKNWENTQNLYIEGDNLDVLKLLQESYLGKVKMIYIDPPYNTGKDFIYCDDFTLGCEEYIEKKGQCDIETNERLFRNTETNGRFHSDWCSMMYPRLKIARDLLSDDGVIFISIDENEVANLQKLCDEIYGEENHIETFHVQVRYANKSLTEKDDFSRLMEYVFIYTKNRHKFVPKKETIDYDVTKFNLDIKELKNPDKTIEIAGKKVEVFLADSFTISTVTDKETLSYQFFKETWVTGSIYSGTGHGKIYQQVVEPRVGADGYGALYKIYGLGEDGLGYRYMTGPKQKNANYGKMYNKIPLDKLAGLKAGTYKKPVPIINLYNYSADFGNIRNEGGIAFNSGKKPVKMLKNLLNIADTKNAIVIDFFSGSASMAHAVMQLNAEDGGNRKFIMVQLPEATDEKSEAYKAGYKNICEIGKERIRRAGDKIMSEHPDAKIDTGFRVFRLDDTNMKDVYYKPVDTAQNSLLDMVDNIKPDRTDMDLLFGAMLERGLMLDMPVEEVQSNGITYYVVNNGDLIACFAENIPESVIHEIANRRPLQALFRDSSFAESKDKINLTEIFKNVDSNIKVCVL